MVQPMNDDPDMLAATAGLLKLAEYGIPVDVQEMLVRGDPMRGIKPGALSAAFKATAISYRSADKSRKGA